MLADRFVFVVRTVARPALAALAATGALALSACASTSQETGAPEGRLIGQPVARALELLGPDPRVEEAADGGALYHWTVIEDLLAPGHAGPPNMGVSRRGTGTYTGGQRAAPRLVSQVCEVTVEVAPAGTISGWRVSGEACVDILRTRLR